MYFSLIVQAVLSGVTNGAIYALIGVGLAVIFKGSRVINAMQGEICIVSAVICVFFMRGLGFSYPAAFLAGVLCGALIGLFIEWGLVRPMIRRHAGEDAFLLLTVGLGYTFSASTLYFAGRDYFSLPTIGQDATAIIFDATIRHHAIWVIGLTALLVVAVRLFYTHTILGLSMMAASIDADGAMSCGIDTNRSRALTYAMGGLLGAVAGLLVAPLIPLNYHMGLLFTLKGFCAAMIGGLTNPMGAIVGGIILGLFESMAIVFLSSAYKDIAALSTLLVIMMLFPYGMLGHAGRKGG